MIPQNIKSVLDAKSEQVLVATTQQLNPVTQRAAERQAATGIQGSAAHGFYIGAYFDFFKSAVTDLFTTTLRLLDVSEPTSEAEILDYMDGKISPFRSRVEEYIFRISRAPYSVQEPDLKTAYAKLRQNFSVELSIVRAKRIAAQSVPSAVTIHGGSHFQIGSHNVQKAGN